MDKGTLKTPPKDFIVKLGIWTFFPNKGVKASNNLKRKDFSKSSTVGIESSVKSFFSVF
jgi:hypothetical protein